MRNRQLGMSLVELLVAVAIGLIGMVIITQAYLTGDRFNRSTLGEGGAQTNGLVGLYTIERDVRSAGYGITDEAALGCGELFWFYNDGVSQNYSPNMQAGSPLPRVMVAPVFIGTDSTAPLTDPDAVTVMFATAGTRMLPGQIKGFSPSTNEVTVDSWTGFALNDMVLLMSSTGCTLRRITAIDRIVNRFQLNPSGIAQQNPVAPGLFPSAYGTGDLIVNLGNPVVRTYSVANGRLRVADGPLQNGAAAAAVDLMDGIVDLRAQYGKDNGLNNGTVNAPIYLANDTRVDQFSNTAPANAAEWQQVLSVRIALLARIGTYERPEGAANCDATTVAPSWAGGTFAAIDVATATSPDRCYRYRVFETTIPLRNMVWKATANT
jgi:type IV pilus assembly protein PilW